MGGFEAGLPGSEWDRAFPPLYSHLNTQSESHRDDLHSKCLEFIVIVKSSTFRNFMHIPPFMLNKAVSIDKDERSISTSQLKALLLLHT